MKKNNILEIHFKDFKNFMDEATTALAKRRPLIQVKNVIYFDSVVGFRNFMTVQKIEILTAIATHKPNTIYALAKIVDRDFAGVLRDCSALETTGFLTLKETKDSRSSKRPTLRFPYSIIIVYLPRTKYQIEFTEAA